MTHKFIYRKKSGFTPPLTEWLTDSEISDFFRATLFSRSSHLSNMLMKKRVSHLLDEPLKGNVISGRGLNFLWASFFCRALVARKCLEKKEQKNDEKSKCFTFSVADSEWYSGCRRQV